ncbi:MAG: hypothetical protein Q9218_003005 [Villophora microphyllina]
MFVSSIISFTFLCSSFVRASPFVPPDPRFINNGLVADDDDALDPCTSYSACGAKGHELWTTLLNTVSKAQPVDRTHTQNPPDVDVFHSDYQTEIQGIEEFGASVSADLAAKGLDLSKMGLYATWTVNPTTQNDEDTAYMNIFDTAGGAILAIENWRDRDSRKTLPWSELMYQTWAMAKEAEDDIYADRAIHPYEVVPGHNISSLQYSVQVQIANAHTKAIIVLAHNSMGFPTDHNDPVWRKWTEEDTPNWFLALLGTDNCKGTMWLLNDHAAEIGKKDITEIWTRYAFPYPDLWMNIGPADWAKYLTPMDTH